MWTCEASRVRKKLTKTTGVGAFFAAYSLRNMFSVVVPLLDRHHAVPLPYSCARVDVSTFSLVLGGQNTLQTRTRATERRVHPLGLFISVVLAVVSCCLQFVATHVRAAPAVKRTFSENTTTSQVCRISRFEHQAVNCTSIW